MELLKKLREMSGAGMLDCKKALEESGNNLEKAIEILRKKGIAKAAKREGREANEGVILLEVNAQGNEGYMVEVNAETDFVARNEKFLSLAEKVMQVIKTAKPTNLDILLSSPLENSTVRETIDELSGTIGEKMGIKQFAIVSGATVAGYSHLGGKIGVLVALDVAKKNELTADIAMQIAATNPLYINPSEIPTTVIEKEKEIETEVLTKEGKPAAVIEKILVGKINKYFENNCLIKQEFIKDDSRKVEQILDGAKILSFKRFSLE
ncbi:MAG: translation elongation factor Ts [Patescibacteria group bacterium]|jgi:elongation factor Ts